MQCARSGRRQTQRQRAPRSPFPFDLGNNACSWNAPLVRTRRSPDPTVAAQRSAEHAAPTTRKNVMGARPSHGRAAETLLSTWRRSKTRKRNTVNAQFLTMRAPFGRSSNEQILDTLFASGALAATLGELTDCHRADPEEGNSPSRRDPRRTATRHRLHPWPRWSSPLQHRVEFLPYRPSLLSIPMAQAKPACRELWLQADDARPRAAACHTRPAQPHRNRTWVVGAAVDTVDFNFCAH
jgi:hypothetical protein